MDASFVNDGNSAGGSLFFSSRKYSGEKVTEIFGINISGGFFTDLYSCFFVPIQMRFKHMSSYKYKPPLHQDYGCPFVKGSLNYVTRCSDMRCSKSIICFTYKHFSKISESRSCFFFDVNAGLWGLWQDKERFQANVLGCSVLFGFNKRLGIRLLKNIKRVEGSVCVGPNIFLNLTNFVGKMMNLDKPYADWADDPTCLPIFVDIVVKIAALRVIYSSGRSFEFGFTMTNFIQYDNNGGNLKISLKNPLDYGWQHLFQVYIDLGLAVRCV